MGIKPPSRATLKRWLLDAAILLAVFMAINAWQQRDVPSGAAPPITSSLANGQTFSLDDWQKVNAGHAVALHFWADWCPICQAEEGSITALGKDWPVMTVAMRSGAAAQVADHLKRRGLSWQTLVDADGRIAASYGLKGVPAFVAIDRNGLIRSVSIGYTTELGMRVRLWWADRF